MQLFPQLYTDSLGEIVNIIKRIINIRVEDVAEFNELARIRGYQSGFCHATKTITASYSAGLVDLFIDADATSGAVTITLPSNPVDGETHFISKTDASGNAVAISGNGKNINGSASVSTTTRYAVYRIVYMGGSGEWRIF